MKNMPAGFKIFIGLMFFLTVLIVLAPLLHAESVFLKDGSIIDGKISADTDRGITIKLADGKQMEIARKDVLRTLYHENFRDKRYIYKMDGSVVEAYVVDEDKDNYTYRLNLTAADEVRISKNDVDHISKRKVQVQVQVIEKKSEPVKEITGRKENILNSASRIRFALGVYQDFTDEDLNEIYSRRQAPFPCFVEVDIWRNRDEKGNGLDIFTRMTVKGFNWDRGKFEKFKSFNKDIPSSASVAKDDTNSYTFLHYGFSGGARYITGVYMGGILWQGYASLAYQFIQTVEDKIMIDISGNSKTTQGKSYTSPIGILGGAGIEISFSSYVGIFTEITMGYNPVNMWGKTRNIEGVSVYYGATLRTSYF